MGTRWIPFSSMTARIVIGAFTLMAPSPSISRAQDPSSSPPSQFNRPSLTGVIPTAILDLQQLKLVDGFNVLDGGKPSEVVLTRNGNAFKPTYLNDAVWSDPLNEPFQNRRGNVLPIDFSDFLSQSNEVWTSQSLAGNRDRLFFLSAMAARICPPLAAVMSATTIRLYGGGFYGQVADRLRYDYGALAESASLPPTFRDSVNEVSVLFGIEERLVGPSFKQHWNERLNSCLGREISQASTSDRAALTLRLRYLGDTLAQLPPLPMRASMVVRTASRATEFEGVSLDLPKLTLNQLAGLVYESRASVCTSDEMSAASTRNWCSATLINEANVRGWSVKPSDGGRYEIIPFNGDSARRLLMAAQGQSLFIKPNRTLDWRSIDAASLPPRTSAIPRQTP